MFGARQGFKVCTGARYLGGYISDNKLKSDWHRERTLTWEKYIGMIRKNVGKYTQESYTAVVRAIQSYWIFMQHVTWDTVDLFVGSGEDD